MAEAVAEAAVDKMKKILFIGILFTVLMLSGCITKIDAKINNKLDNSYNEDENTVDLTSFAQCLTEKGVTMYGTEWCGHCKNQKEMFGNAFQYINYVDCDLDKAACSAAGVRGYPTWNIDGENYPGEKPLAQLSELSGCELITI